MDGQCRNRIIPIQIKVIILSIVGLADSSRTPVSEERTDSGCAVVGRLSFRPVHS